jgi:transcriptional regulator with XRE-family HTH domain
MTLAARIAVSVGAELCRLRLAAGFTQAELARRTGTHRPIIGRTERGHHTPTLELAVLQAEHCGGSARNVLRAVDRACGLRSIRRVSARAAR